MSWYIQTERSKYTNIVFFHSDSQLVQQFSMTKLLSKWNFEKNVTVFLLSTILNRSQSALRVTDDSRMKDVVQLTAGIVMASSNKKKNIWLKNLKTALLECSLLVTISLWNWWWGPNLLMKRQDL